MTVYLGPTSVWTGLGRGTSANMELMLNGADGLHATSATAASGLTRLETMLAGVAGDVCRNGQLDVATERTGIIFSTTKGNISHLTTATPSEGDSVYLQVMARNVCRAIGAVSEPIVVSNACISGVVAVVVAQRLIRAGLYDDVLVVGGDEMTEFTTSGFMAFKSVSSKPCRPYDAERDGLSLGEAAAAIVLTSDSGKSGGIVVSGGAMSNDANHISGPSRTGEPLSEAINQAIAEAGISASDISFINAHGTATVYNDEMESKAVNLSGLQSKPINSLKPYIGHTLGASGVVEIAIAAEEMRRGIVIGTKGFSTPGTPMPLNVSAENRPTDGLHCVKSASGFGGCNAAVVLSKEETSHPSASIGLPEVETIHRCTMANGTLTLDGQVLTQSDANFATFVREVYHAQEANMKFFKMTDMCKMGYLAANCLLSGISHEPYDIAVVLSNRSSSLDADLQHWRIMKVEGKEASPAAFVYTLPNIVMGEMAIRHGIKGETTFFVTNDPHDAQVENYARMLLHNNRYKMVLTGWCELLEDQYNLDIRLIRQKA